MRQRWDLGPFSESKCGPRSKRLGGRVTRAGGVGFGSQILATEEGRTLPLCYYTEAYTCTHTCTCACAVPVRVTITVNIAKVCKVHSRHASPSLQSIRQKPPHNNNHDDKVNEAKTRESSWSLVLVLASPPACPQTLPSPSTRV